MASSRGPVPGSEVAAQVAPRRARRGLSLRSQTNGWIFVGPTVVILLLLAIFPLIFSVALSFSNVSQDNGLTFASATLDNWKQLVTDAGFWQSLQFTIGFVVVAVLAEFLIGFGLALLL